MGKVCPIRNESQSTPYLTPQCAMMYALVPTVVDGLGRTIQQGRPRVWTMSLETALQALAAMQHEAREEFERDAWADANRVVWTLVVKA